MLDDVSKTRYAHGKIAAIFPDTVTGAKHDLSALFCGTWEGRPNC